MSHNMIFPIWVYPFIPKSMFLAFTIKLALHTIIVYIYFKKQKELNNPQIYCFRAFGSERSSRPKINSKVIFRYSFRAALFSCFTDYLAGIIMVSLLNSAVFFKYVDTDFLWSNFISGSVHVIIVLFIGILIYLYHRRMGRKLGLKYTKARGLGLIMGILTAPWFFLIPTIWLY